MRRGIRATPSRIVARQEHCAATRGLWEEGWRLSRVAGAAAMTARSSTAKCVGEPRVPGRPVFRVVTDPLCFDLRQEVAGLVGDFG